MANDLLGIWATTLGSDASDYVWSIKTSRDGSIFIGGSTEGSLDGQVNSGGMDAFLTKYSLDGKKQWTKLLGSAGYEAANALSVGLDGSIYLSGWTSHALDGQAPYGNIDGFLTKYSADGFKIWTKLIGSNGADTSQAVTTGLDGSIYIAGQTEGSLDGQINNGAKDAFLTKYNSDGEKIWTKLLGSSKDDEARALTIGLDGSIYITGWTSQALDGQSASGGQDAFLAKYSPDGTKIWTRLLGTDQSDQAIAVATGLDGSIYIGGRTNGWLDGQVNSGAGDAFLTKYSPNGTKIWTKLLGTEKNEEASALTIGLDGSIYVGGLTNGFLDNNEYKGGMDAFITNYDTDGRKLWTKLLGSSGQDEVQSLATGLDGSIYLTGATDKSFDGLINNGGVDVFIAKYQPTTIKSPTIKLTFDTLGSIVNFKLSSPSPNFSLNSVSVIGGTLKNFIGANENFTAIFIPDGKNLLNATVKVESGAFTDVAGNKNTDGADADNMVSIRSSAANTNSPPSSNSGTPISTEVPYIPYGNGRYFLPSAGAEKITGTAFLDVVRKTSNHDSNLIIKLTDGSWQIQHKANPINTDTLFNIERVDFTDVSLALDISGSAGQVAKILGAVFGPASVKNATFAGIGLAYLDSGMSYSALADLAAAAAGLNNPDSVVSTLWQNIIGSAASAANKAPYIKLLNDGMSIGDLVTLAADSPVNAQSIDFTTLSGAGLTFIPYSIPVVPTYKLSAQASVNEGEALNVQLSTTNVSTGTLIDYVISGVEKSDLGGTLTGKVSVDASGRAVINVITLADSTTEGPETMTISLGGATAQVVINDTSITLVGIIDDGGGGGGGGGGGD